jgi:hypothetical protein
MRAPPDPAEDAARRKVKIWLEAALVHAQRPLSSIAHASGICRVRLAQMRLPGHIRVPTGPQTECIAEATGYPTDAALLEAVALLAELGSTPYASIRMQRNRRSVRQPSG